MAKFQLLTGFVNLAGDRNNVAYRGTDSPITYPESLVLQAVHGGGEHVHTLIEIGEVERSPEEELERLTLRYGKVAADVFPSLNGRATLPERDDALPTAEAVAASREAATEALASAKTKANKTKTDKTKAPDTPDAGLSLDNLTS